MKNSIKKYINLIVFSGAILIAGFLHGYNMLHFPYYESDEGTYTSQSWAVVTEHKLSPYTYWYDHPPFGWFFLASWHELLPSKFFTFGSSLDTGRVFMLIIHLITAGLIYYIVYRITKKNWPSFLAVILFSISPLEIYFQRRILLDNMMIMWVLLSVAVLYIKYNRLRLFTYVWSGVFFALAVLTKVTAIMFGPAILYLVWFHRSPIERYFRSISWLLTGILTVSIYLLSAFLQGEFFPGDDHVSFLGALQFQTSRGGGHFWKAGSDFYLAVGDWINKDAGILVIIAIILVLSIIISFFRKKIIFFLLATLLYILFLIRGGVVIDFYILPLFPFVAILGGLSWHYFIKSFSYYALIYNFLFLITIGGIFYYYYTYASHKVFLRDATSNQTESIRWIKNNLPADSRILIDIYSYVDLHDSHYLTPKTFKNADWYYKVSRDKEVGEKKYNNDWRNFDYIFLTHEMLKQIKDGDDDFIKIAFQNSLPYKKWTKNTHSFIDEQKFLSTDGDWTMLFKINDNTQTELRESWLKYKETYIHSYGQVVNPANGLTTSEGQALAMLKAVEMNDQKTFQGLWLWTHDHLQFRVQDRLFSQKWFKDKTLETDNDSAADGDIAMALLFAYKEWGEKKYLENAQEIIRDIWKQDVVQINGKYYLLSTNELSAHRGTIADPWYSIMPANFSPSWYRIFAQVDSKHNWSQLANDTYNILNRVSKEKLFNSIIPNEFLISPKLDVIKKPKIRKDIIKNKEVIDDEEKIYKKFHLLWRVALDLKWFHPDVGEQFIEKFNDVLLSDRDKLSKGLMGDITAEVKIISPNKTMAIQFGYIMALLFDSQEQKTHNYYDQHILTQYDYINNLWRGDKQYINNTWGWFIMSTYNNKFINLWEKDILIQ